MRKIESQMCAAIHNNQNWSNANTTVHFNEEENVSVVRLHGNKIAEIDDNSMTIFDGGYQSVTTKSRLNALCSEFCIEGECVYQKNFQWYVDKFVGMAGQSKVFNTYDFTNGFIFAWSLTNISPMKIVLVAIIGVLLWQSTDAREFTSNALQSASDFIEPNNTKSQTIGERIDSFLN